MMVCIRGDLTDVTAAKAESFVAVATKSAAAGRSYLCASPDPACALAAKRALAVLPAATVVT